MDWTSDLFEGNAMEEVPAYRSFSLPANAQHSTSVSDELCVETLAYRSLSFMPQPVASITDTAESGALDTTEPGVLTMAMPSFGKKHSELFDVQYSNASPWNKTAHHAPALIGLYHLERTHFRSSSRSTP
jgi:hypothetical protein